MTLTFIFAKLLLQTSSNMVYMFIYFITQMVYSLHYKVGDYQKNETFYNTRNNISFLCTYISYHFFIVYFHCNNDNLFYLMETSNEISEYFLFLLQDLYHNENTYAPKMIHKSVKNC